MLATSLLIFALAVMMAPAAQLLAQPSAGLDEVQPQIWLDYNPSFTPSPRTSVYGDIGFRRVIDQSTWAREYIRPGIRFQATPRIRLSGGVGAFFTANQSVADRLEIRPWQGAQFEWPRGTLSIRHYVRLEERFDVNVSTRSSLNSVRARYQIRPTLEWDRRGIAEYWRAFLAVEAFARFAGDQGQFEEDWRLTAGIEHAYPNGLRIRADATWQRTGRVFTGQDIQGIYLRLRVFHPW